MSSGAARRTRDRAIALVLVIVLPVAGCHKWSAVDNSPASVVSEREPGQVRVTLSDGTVVRLRRPLVQGDSLVGQALVGEGTTTRGAVALADIQAMEVRKTDALATAGVATLAVAGILTVGGLIVCGSEATEGSLFPC